MKKFLAAVLAAAMLVTLSAQAALATEINVGETFLVTGFVDKDGNSADDKYWSKEYNTVRATYTQGGNMVGQPYIDDGDSCIYIKAKLNASVKDYKQIEGVVTVTDKQSKERFTAEILFTIAPMEDIPILEIDSKHFELPESYHNGRTTFRAYGSTGSYGTLDCTFREYDSFETVAYYTVTIADQAPLILYNDSTPVMDIFKKYEDATLRFVNWTSNPKFDKVGTLGIVMEREEFLYKVNADKTISAVSGSYNGERGVFEFKTNTLGSYVISDIKLSGAGTAASESSSAPAASSSKAPPAVASSVAPAPSASSSKPASSVAPAPSSSSALVESSSSSEPESSSEPASSSEPVPEPESSKPESSSTVAQPEKDEGDGGFPIIPVVIGVGVVAAVGVAAYFLIARKNGGKKDYDSWDD